MKCFFCQGGKFVINSDDRSETLMKTIHLKVSEISPGNETLSHRCTARHGADNIPAPTSRAGDKNEKIIVRSCRKNSQCSNRYGHDLYW